MLYKNVTSKKTILKNAPSKRQYLLITLSSYLFNYKNPQNLFNPWLKPTTLNNLASQHLCKLNKTSATPTHLPATSHLIPHTSYFVPHPQFFIPTTVTVFHFFAKGFVFLLTLFEKPINKNASHKSLLGKGAISNVKSTTASSRAT